MDIRLFWIPLAWIVGWWLCARVQLLPTSRIPKDVLLPSVSVIIPAYNQEEQLPVLLASLRQQTIKPSQIIVVDDDSDDRTAEVARAMGATVVTTPELPDGWARKSWASWIGAQKASGQLLVFLDSDVHPTAQLISRLLVASAPQSALVSVQPYLEMQRARERVVSFLALFGIMATGAGALGKRRDARSGFGPVVAVRRKDYFAIGGHSAVNGALTSSATLAQRFRKNGIPIRSFGGRGSVNIDTSAISERRLVRRFSMNLAAMTRSSGLAVIAIAFWTFGMITSGAIFGAWILGFQRGAFPLVLFTIFMLQVGLMLRQLGTFGWWAAFAYPVLGTLGVLLYVRSAFRVLAMRIIPWRARRLRVAAPNF